MNKENHLVKVFFVTFSQDRLVHAPHQTDFDTYTHVHVSAYISISTCSVYMYLKYQLRGLCTPPPPRMTQ